MGNEITPFDPLAGQSLGMMDRLRARQVVSQATFAEIQIASHARTEAIKKELEHQARVREEGRAAERTHTGIHLAAGIYDSLVEKSQGDPSRAAFLAGIATRGRDAIQGQI